MRCIPKHSKINNNGKNLMTSSIYAKKTNCCRKLQIKLVTKQVPKSTINCEEVPEQHFTVLKKSISVKNPIAQFTLKISANQDLEPKFFGGGSNPSGKGAKKFQSNINCVCKKNLLHFAT